MDDPLSRQLGMLTVPLKKACTMPIPCTGKLLNLRPGEMVTEHNAIEDDVRRFITENFPLGGGGHELAGSDSLLEVGVIDSVGVLELIEHVESTYDLQIPDADVLPENLDSIDAIARYVVRRLAAADGDSDGTG
jgi:acyl carrier protein